MNDPSVHFPRYRLTLQVPETDQENVFNDFCGEKDEDHDKDETVDAVVHVVQRRPLHRDEGGRRQDRRQDDEERHVAGDRAVLNLEDETQFC